MSEGNILVLGDTEIHSHGIVLIVGREPNNDSEKITSIGKYGKQWDASGKGSSCQFWDMAYSLNGKIVNMDRSELKAKCMQMSSSPVAFADLSPLSLDGDYSPVKKIKLRKQIKKSEYENHINSIFSHKKFIDRVDLVICAGHKGAGLTNGYPILEDLCNQSRIRFCHTASLNSTRHTLDHRLVQMGNNKKIISNTFSSFFTTHESTSFSKAA